MMRILLCLALLVVFGYSLESEDASWEEIIPEEIMNLNSEELDNDLEVFGDMEFLNNPDSIELEDLADFADILDDSDDSEDDIIEFSDELSDIDDKETIDELVDADDIEDVDDLKSKAFFGTPWGRRGGRGFYKRGSCPTVEARNVTEEANETESESCEDECANHFDCSGRSLCCDSGCGNVCTLPEVRFCTIKNVRFISGRRIYMRNGHKLATCKCNRGDLRCKDSSFPFPPTNPSNDLSKLIRRKPKSIHRLLAKAAKDLH